MVKVTIKSKDLKERQTEIIRDRKLIPIFNFIAIVMLQVFSLFARTDDASIIINVLSVLSVLSVLVHRVRSKTEYMKLASIYKEAQENIKKRN